MYSEWVQIDCGLEFSHSLELMQSKDGNEGGLGMRAWWWIVRWLMGDAGIRLELGGWVHV